MTPAQKSEVRRLRQEATVRMVRYMKFGAAESADDPDYDSSFDAGYTQKHVDRCAKIIDAYLDVLEQMRSPREDQKILFAAEKAVRSLNTLNEQCGGSLIATDQREDICGLMISAAKHAGLTIDGDFTEEWREW